MLQPFNPKAFKGIFHYIDEFQSWVEELDGLRTRSYDDADKKRLLLRNLMRVPNIPISSRHVKIGYTVTLRRHATTFVPIA